MDGSELPSSKNRLQAVRVNHRKHGSIPQLAIASFLILGPTPICAAVAETQAGYMSNTSQGPRASCIVSHEEKASSLNPTDH